MTSFPNPIIPASSTTSLTCSMPLSCPSHRTINWNLLSTQDLEAELLELNRWVDWLRHTYGLPAAVIPPYWHRHPEMVWELSALHLH